MKSETFEQKRMVQLSRQLDRQRQRSRKLIQQTQELAETLKGKEKQQSISIQAIQIQRRKITQFQQQIREQNNAYRLMALQNESLKEKNESVELQNVRQRQQIDGYKEQLLKYENKMKDILFQKQKQLNIKEKDNFKLRQENIEVQKLYLKMREQLQKEKQMYFRKLTKVKTATDQLRKQTFSIQQYLENMLEVEKVKNLQQFKQVHSQIKRIQTTIEEQKKLKKQIKKIKCQLEDVVAENSQKIIQLYRYKNYE